jgi:hypothetical protein
MMNNKGRTMTLRTARGEWDDGRLVPWYALKRVLTYSVLCVFHREERSEIRDEK